MIVKKKLGVSKILDSGFWKLDSVFSWKIGQTVVLGDSGLLEGKNTLPKTGVRYHAAHPEGGDRVASAGLHTPFLKQLALCSIPPSSLPSIGVLPGVFPCGILLY